MTTKFYIGTDDKPCVSDLVLVGPGDKKRDLCNHLDPRLIPVSQIITCDVNQQITDILPKVTLKKNNPLYEWNNHIHKETGRAIYGKKEVEHYLLNGLLEKLFIPKSKLNQKIKSTCKDKGVTIVFIPEEELSDFGEILGLSWY